MSEPIASLHQPWRATVVTLFPELFPGPLAASLAGDAFKRGVWGLETVALRDFGIGRHRQVDDTPAGDGAGMVLRAALASARSAAADGPGERNGRYLGQDVKVSSYSLAIYKKYSRQLR